MKNTITAIIFLIYGLNLLAQDIIVLKSTEEIKTKVIEIDTDKVKYKLWDNLEGPIYNVLKSDIFMIKYENGKKETFENTTTTTQVSNTGNGAIKNEKLDNWVGLGLTFYNPIAGGFSNLGADPGSSFYASFEGGGFLTKNISFTTCGFLLLANAYNIDNERYDASFSGFGFLGKAAYHWIKKEKLSIYSGAGIGYLSGNITVSDNSYSVSDNYSGVAYQIDAIGFRSKLGKRLSVSTELGFGYQGVFQTGIYYNW